MYTKQLAGTRAHATSTQPDHLASTGSQQKYSQICPGKRNLRKHASASAQPKCTHRLGFLMFSSIISISLRTSPVIKWVPGGCRKILLHGRQAKIIDLARSSRTKVATFRTSYGPVFIEVPGCVPNTFSLPRQPLFQVHLQKTEKLPPLGRQNFFNIGLMWASSYGAALEWCLSCGKHSSYGDQRVFMWERAIWPRCSGRVYGVGFTEGAALYLWQGSDDGRGASVCGLAPPEAVIAPWDEDTTLTGGGRRSQSVCASAHMQVSSSQGNCPTTQFRRHMKAKALCPPQKNAACSKLN